MSLARGRPALNHENRVEFRNSTLDEIIQGFADSASGEVIEYVVVV
ncbi:MAG: hypothetical protein H7146_04825 [Burkholderiaceae bacterium]|nr:hypothetical protein [Microbacteriaceae bacterium]